MIPAARHGSPSLSNRIHAQLNVRTCNQCTTGVLPGLSLAAHTQSAELPQAHWDSMPAQKRKPLGAKDVNSGGEAEPADTDAGRVKALQIIETLDEQGKRAAVRSSISSCFRSGVAASNRRSISRQILRSADSWAWRCAVRDKCSELLRMADDAALALKNEYALQLLKLPKKVREGGRRQRLLSRVLCSVLCLPTPPSDASHGRTLLSHTAHEGEHTVRAALPAAELP